MGHEIEITEQYKGTGIIPRGNTISSKISTEIIGKDRQIEKTVEEKLTMDMGTGTRKWFHTNKTSADRKTMFSTLRKR